MDENAGHRAVHGQPRGQDNAKTSELVAGRWWRATKYELREGYIRPAAGARFRQYDPLERWLGTRPVGHGAYQGQDVTPYQSLLDLLDGLECEPTGEPPSPEEQKFAQALGVKAADFVRPLDPGQVGLMPGARLSSDSEAKIVEWCEANGLLGILPHRVLQMTLAPKGVTQVQYNRIGAGWTAIERQRARNEPPQWTPTPPGAIVHGLQGPGIAFESLAASVGRFFPDLPTDERALFQYPQPLALEFWATYAEPLADFINSAHLLKQVFEALREHSPARANRRARALHHVLTGGTHNLIDAATHGASLAFATASPRQSSTESNKKAGQTRLYLVGPSLLSSLTIMLLEDLIKGRPLQCQCGRLFVSTTYHQGPRYCSERCRHKYEKRRQRASRQVSGRENVQRG